MSRAYRIKVRESVSRVITAHDHISTRLELLEVLPADEMAALLKEQLAGAGFEEQGEEMVRRDAQRGVLVAVDPKTGEVTVAAESSEEVVSEGEKSGYGDTDWSGEWRGKAEERLRNELREDLGRQAEQQTERIQTAVTETLERELAGLKAELDRVVNRTTVEALKRKAGRLGRVKELSEDPEAGIATIVVEV